MAGPRLSSAVACLIGIVLSGCGEEPEPSKPTELPVAAIDAPAGPGRQDGGTPPYPGPGPEDGPVAPPPDLPIVDAAAGEDAAGPGPDTALPPPPPDVAPPPPDMPPAPAVPRDVDGRIVINEFMTSNGLTLKNEAGLAGDWIELFNPTSQDIPLAGYAITDDFNLPAKAVIREGVVLRARGHLILWADGEVARGPTHLGLKLVAEGGVLGLTRPDGSFISRLTYGAQETDFSASREPDGSDRWVIEWHPSPGAANPAGSGRPLAPATAATPPESVPAAGDVSEELLGGGAISQLRVNVESADVNRLLGNPRMYVPATLVFKGRSYGPVGLRVKGSASFQPFDQKPSLRINVDEYVPDAKFYGLKDLTLNNMFSDHSMMRERLGYWIARNSGIPASRCAHAMVSINGQPPALYANVETVKRRMLSRWFRNADGALYEATDVDFTTRDTMFPHSDGRPRDDIAFYQLQSQVDDRRLLYGLAEALTISSPDQAMAAAANYLNVAEWQSFWAFTAIVGQFDGMPYSMPGDDYFVYGNPEDNKIQLIPWGIDETFNAGDVDVVQTAYSVLARTCAASSSCRQGFATRVWAIMDKMDQLNWEGERAKIAQEIAPYVSMDRRKVYTDQQVLAEQENLRYFLLERRMTLGMYVPPP
jgi:hypothetical protein